MKNQFKDILKGKVVVVGVGNPVRGDDAFGPALIERVKGNINAACIDAGTTPESFTGKISKEKPDTILIIDAVYLDRSPGEYGIFMKDEIIKSGFTTHDISPSMFIEYLQDQTKANIYMLGVQPKNISLGEEMSDEVKKTLSDVAKLLEETINA